MAEYKTTVRKKIGRKIQTARFESLEVACEWEDEITWSDAKDRQEKLDKVAKAGMHDFQRSFDMVCKFLNVGDKQIGIERKLEDGSVKQGSATIPSRPPGGRTLEKNEDDIVKTLNDDGDLFDEIGE